MFYCRHNHFISRKQRSIDRSIYLSNGSTALVDIARFFSFLIYTQSVGLLRRGTSPSQGRYIHIERHKHRINAYRYPTSSGIRTQYPSFRVGEDSSCFRPHGHFDRHIYHREIILCTVKQYSIFTWQPILYDISTTARKTTTNDIFTPFLWYVWYGQRNLCCSDNLKCLFNRKWLQDREEYTHFIWTTHLMISLSLP
jgi:hypothetical protein